MGGKMINRRSFLKLTGEAVGAASVGLFAACRAERITAEKAGEALEGQPEAGSAASRGRLLARPTPPSGATASAGLRPLGLGSARDGLL